MKPGGISSELSRKLSSLAFLCTLLVVIIHLENMPDAVGTFAWGVGYFFKNILAITAVPFFFATSGFLLAKHVGESGWWRRAIRQRLRTLGVPYLVWCLVPFVLFTFLWPVDTCGGECGRIQLRWSSIAAAFGLNFFTVPEASRPLWYLRALFILVVLSPLIAWALRRWKAWTLFVLFVFYWTANPGLCNSPDFWLSVRWQVVWKFGFSVEGLFYFAAGLYLWEHPISISRIRGLLLGVLGLAVGCVGLFVKANGWTDCGYLASLSIPLTMGLIWTAADCVHFPQGLAKNAFAIYVMHPIILRALNASGFLPHGSCTALVEWMVTVFAAIVLSSLLRRLSPRFAAVVFGNR